MKLNHPINKRENVLIIQQFGQAKLIRRPDGKHELVGGSPADVAEANEWVSLVAHEIVFSRPGCKPPLKPRMQGKFFSFRLRSR